MKTKKNRIALSALSIVLVLALLAGGTMAWFTDTEKVNANFAAGVLDISLHPDEEGEQAKAPMTFTNLRPLTVTQFDAELIPEGLFDADVNVNKNTEGFDPVPVYFQPVTITNDGTLPVYIQITAESLFGTEGFACPEDGEENITLGAPGNPDKVTWDKEGERPACTNGLEDKLKIFVYAKDGTGNWVRQEGVNLNTETLAEDGEGNLLETATFIPSKENYIAANGKVTYVVGGYLPDDAGNAYQGRHYHGNVVVNAYQTDDNAGINPPEDPDAVRNEVTLQFKENGDLVRETRHSFISKKSDSQYVLTQQTMQSIIGSGYEVTGVEKVIKARLARSVSEGVQMAIPLEDGKLVDENYKTIIVLVRKTGISVPVKFLNTGEPEGILDTIKYVSFKEPGTVTVATGGTESDTYKTVTAPHGFVFDPAEQSQTFTLTESGPVGSEVIFTVKPVGGEPTTPPDPSAEFVVNANFIVRDGDKDILLEKRPIKLTGADFGGKTKLNLVTDSSVTEVGVPMVLITDAPAGCAFAPQAQLQSVYYQAASNSLSPSEVTFTVSLVNPVDCPYPHILRTQADLDQVRYHMSHTFVVANDISLSGNWTPLGGSNTYQSRAYANTSEAFNGMFYGGGHTVSNLKVVCSNGPTYYWNMYSDDRVWYADFNGGSDELYYNRGLFAINNGKINGVKLANVDVQASALAGALAGQNGEYGVIENCQVTGGSVSVDFMACVNNSLQTTLPYEGSYTRHGAFAGGLVGLNAGGIKNCASEVTGQTTAPSQVWVGRYAQIGSTSIDNITQNTGTVAGLNIGVIEE